jgi:integrase
MPKKYDAATDYRTRGYEADKRVIQFGTHKITLYKRSDVHNSSWSFRIHLKEEDRHYRKSLRTADYKDAVAASESAVIDLLATVKSGQRVLALRLADLHRKFSVLMDRKVEQGEISKNTWKNQSYRIRLGLEYIKTKYKHGLETRITDIDGKVFNDYLDWRIAANKEKGRGLRRDVIRDELLVIRKMFHFALKNSLCHQKSVPVWDFAVEKQGPIRARITANDRKLFKKKMDLWITYEAEKSDSEQLKYHRRMLATVILLAENGGMRSGEIFGLTNNDVSRIGEYECLIKIRPETSKVRKGRQIIVRSEAMASWLEDYQKWKGREEFFFAPFHNGKTSARNTFYHQYAQLREYLKPFGIEWYDLYHCRHWWVTNRLLAGEDIYQIAQAAGTSVKEIESTYSHVLTAETTRKFNRTRVQHNEDGTHQVIAVTKFTNAELEEIRRKYHLKQVKE